jgi:hypothetical protein
MKYGMKFELVDQFLSSLSYKELEQAKEELQHCTPMPEIQKLIERVEEFMQKKREQENN